MNDRLLHTPDGVRDIYNSECADKLFVEAKLEGIFKSYGYDCIQTPTFEYYDIFREERGTVHGRDMYKFFDRDGETLVVRPDMTPSIARCAAKYYRDEKGPVRLWYKGNTFINSSEYQGRQKETTQIGCELINGSDEYCDAEILALTVNCMLEAGLKEFRVEVGEVSFFKAIVEEAGLDSEQVEILRKYIIEKNSYGLDTFLLETGISENLRKLFFMLPTMFGSFDKLDEIRALTDNRTALAAIDRLQSIYDIMKLYGYEKYIGFDFGMLSKYRYYTGIIFNAYTYGIGDAIISGGRYDNLVGQFGKKASAVGMAVVSDRLMLALSRQGIEVGRASEKKTVTVSRAEYPKVLSETVRARAAGECIEIIVREDSAEA